MSSKGKYYITTAIAYTSGKPHIGNSYEIVLADRAECRRILKEENVAIMCAYMLMHFIHCQGDPLAFLDDIV